jgi:very-short-patch-repair endonuclease
MRRHGDRETAHDIGMESVEAALTRIGGVGTRASLVSMGVSVRSLARSVRDGSIVSVRRGWYALPSAPSDIVQAVRVGGALTSVSAGSHFGLWTLDDGMLHVAVPRHGSRLRSPTDRALPLSLDASARVCLHWRKPSHTPHTIVAPIVATLMHAIECQSEERAIVMIDSALNSRQVTRSQLRRAASSMPSRYAATLAKCDARSQSGTETLVRVRLRRLGIRVRIQVHRPGVGRVDVLVGDRLVIECDSQEFHGSDEAQERDYDRDIELIDGDDLVLRLRYRHVVHEWDRVEAVILRLVRRGRHLNPRKRAS